MEHKYIQLYKFYEENHLCDEIELLCSTALSSNNQIYIEKIKNKLNKLISNNIINIFKEDGNEYTLIEWNPYLSIGIYEYLLKELSLKPPIDTNDLITIDQKIYNFRHGENFARNNRIQLVAQARRFLLIDANFRYDENFREYLSFYSNNLFNATYALEFAFEFLNLIPEDIEYLLNFKNSKINLSIKLLPKLQNMLSNNKELAYLCKVHFIKNKSELSILGNIYSINYNFYNDNSIFSDELKGDLKLFSLSLIKPKNVNDFNLVFNYIEIFENQFPLESLRCLICLMESDYYIPNKDKIIKKIEVLLYFSTDENVKFILVELCFIKKDINRIDEIFLEQIKINPQKYLNNLDIVENYISFINRNDSKLNLLFEVLEILTKPTQINHFRNIINTFKRDEFSLFITKLLNHESPFINSIVKEITLFKFEKNIELDALYLNDLEYRDIKFIANKIIAFIYDNTVLSSLTFSLLKFQKEIDKTNLLVIDIFLNYILFNYRSPIEFLKEKIKLGSKREKLVAKRILKEDDEFWGKSFEVPLLNELKLEDTLLIQFQKQNSVKINKIIKERPNTNSFFDLITKINSKAGRGCIIKDENGNYKISPMSEYKSSFEYPRGEILDLIEQRKIYFQTINYVREL